MGRLMEVSRLYLDANILIMLGEGKDEIAELLTELVGQQQPAETAFLCTSELSLAELLVHPYRHNDERLIDLYDSWLVSGGFMEVGPVDRSVLWHAAVLRSMYTSLKLPDAIHISTAIDFQCSHFLSADTRLPDQIALTHRRWGITKGPAKLNVIRPTADTLRSIIRSHDAL
jgi:predicted nucleic acid-binding protein